MYLNLYSYLWMVSPQRPIRKAATRVALAHCDSCPYTKYISRYRDMLGAGRKEQKTPGESSLQKTKTGAVPPSAKPWGGGAAPALIQS